LLRNRNFRWTVESEQMRDFHWSFDGTELALIRGHIDSDVVLIPDNRK